MTGPLSGRTVLELAGLGPGPFAAMLLADLGADVIRVDRPGGPTVPSADPRRDQLNRGKRSIVLDLKHPEAVQALLRLAASADVFIEGFRPGVVERLGVGPRDLHAVNPRLVYGRMTGWGQDGPRAQSAGHDINYIALTGALHAIGPARGAPQIPLNLVGDLGGGGMYLVVGVLAALLEVQATGRGQVVDASVVDGTAHLLTLIHTLLGSGQWVDRRGDNLIDGGTPFYSVYATKDGHYMAVGAIEPKFYAELLTGLGASPALIDPASQYDRSTWSVTRQELQRIFATRTRREWTGVFEGKDACVSPVLSLGEAPDDPQVAARGTIVNRGGMLHSAPAPRLSAHPEPLPGPVPALGEHTWEILREAGLDAGHLCRTGAATQSSS